MIYAVPAVSIAEAGAKAKAGDEIVLAAGTHDLPYGFAVADGVIVRGAGMDATVLTRTAGMTPFIAAGNGNEFHDITIRAVRNPLSGAQYSYLLDNAGNVYCHQVRFSGFWDNVYGLRGDSNGFEACEFETGYDSFRAFAGTRCTIRGCKFIANKPEQDCIRFIYADFDSVWNISDCQFVSGNPNNSIYALIGNALPFDEGGASAIHLNNCIVNAPCLQLKQDGAGVISTESCHYDAALTQGTIIGTPLPPTETLTAPTDLKVGSNRTLTWKDTATGEDGFHVERAIGDGAFQRIATVTTPKHTDAVLVKWRVQAFKGANVSPWSNITQARL